MKNYCMNKSNNEFCKHLTDGAWKIYDSYTGYIYCAHKCWQKKEKGYEIVIMRIICDFNDNDKIISPKWCPLNKNNKKKGV